MVPLGTIGMTTRRHFLLATASALASLTLQREVEAASKAGDPLWDLSESQWRELLDAEAYRVLRKEGTERPFSSPLLAEKREGVYKCAGCDLSLFSSSTKYDSGTGWPSFTEPLPGNINTKTDYKLLIPRKEYHCRRCGGHQGHVFNDGPLPLGKRYCNNGVALRFVAST